PVVHLAASRRDTPRPFRPYVSWYQHRAGTLHLQPPSIQLLLPQMDRTARSPNRHPVRQVVPAALHLRLAAPETMAPACLVVRTVAPASQQPSPFSLSTPLEGLLPELRQRRSAPAAAATRPSP